VTIPHIITECFGGRLFSETGSSNMRAMDWDAEIWYANNFWTL